MDQNKIPGFRSPNRKNKKPNGLLYLLIITLVLTSLYYIFNPQSQAAKEENTISISEVADLYNKEQITKISVENNLLTIQLKDGDEKYSYKNANENLRDLGLYSDPPKAEVEFINTESAQLWRELASAVIPFFLIIGFLFFMMRQVSKNSSSAFSFGKSKAKVYLKDKDRTTFKDVAGMKESKEELEEIVDFLKNPQKYTKIGAKIPKGVLLIGSPGTGKTLLARAVAGEADAPFYSISGSEFVEMFVGVGASRVRDLFQKAKRNAPAIIFIDEIDAVGRQRGGAGFGGGHDEREQTLNQILTEMDGFDNKTNVIVIAATNRPDVLDSALMRPGRFDRRITVDLPDIEARKEILEVHCRNKSISKDIDLEKIARQTPGFSGADLENIMNEGAILAAKEDRKEITQHDLELSVEKVSMGPERKSKVLNKEERKITAYHEVGHAITGYMCPKCDPVHKVSIISRGMALGVTWFLPEEDRHLVSESKFRDELCSLLGGRVAEHIIFGELTTGASNDLERATKIARNMITKYGMSKRLGSALYNTGSDHSYMRADMGSGNGASDAYTKIIDEEVGELVNGAYKRAHDILTKHKDKLIEISEDLLKKEVLSAEEFAAYFEDKSKKKKAKSDDKKIMKKKSIKK